MIHLRFWVPIFFTGVVLGTVQTSVIAAPGLWLLLFNCLGAASCDFSSISTVLSLVPFAIDPVIAFLAMFLLGLRFEVSLVYARSFAALLFGTAAGTFGFLLFVAIYAVRIGALSDIQAVFTRDLLFDGFGTIRLTMVGFAGLAFAYFYNRTRDNNRAQSSS